MFILRIIRFLCGYVLFRGTGGFSERFLNLCAREGIGIWDVKYKDGVMTAKVLAGNYRLLRPCAAKAGMKLRVCERKGFSFLLYRYRKRVGVLVGIALFTLILTVSSNFVWTIKVEGNTQTETAVILQTMEELGLRAGVVRSGLDISEMQLEALRRLQELSWISVNIRGSVATVEVRERTMPPEMLDESIPCNVVAAADGYIVRIEAYEGAAKVRVGDSVVKGDLLISGVIESKLETTRFVHARGNIIAHTSRRLEVEIPLIRESVTPTGEKKNKYALELFGMRIPLHFSTPQGQDWATQEKENRLQILGLNLPFAVHTTTYQQVERIPEQLTQEQAQRMAREALAQQQEALGKLKILKTEEECVFTSSSCRMVWSLSCEENISVLEQILFDENG